ncbi:hypothetical protein [Pseudomonas benzenivorans]|uniref:Uncharacterized protein n=1 Tax=Pseudomonas benzenivorans TaxID=556533 RepID=A0ABY5H784_9PSED|nr:hypothetical protein [Pseudomonas benzenivorans]UTW07988.1 hypothetical protein KDW96_01230 [Pseudomonas benzenivorans]
MTDIERINLICADFESFLRGNYFAADYACCQESLESLRTRYWYESLKQRFSLSGPSQMERCLEPDAVTWNEDGRKKHSSNKWGRYRDGGRLRQTTLAKVEKNAPGSMRIFNHPLWDVLDFENKEVMEGEAFLQLLSAELQVVLFKRKPIGINSYVERVPVNRFLLRKLELRADLEVLACLTWLLREAAAKKCSNAKEIGDSLHNVLLMMALELHALRVALPLLQHFIGRVLPLGLPRYHQIAITPIQYLELAGALNKLVFNIKGQSKVLQWESRVRNMYRLLSGDFGLDVPLAMSLPTEPDRKLSWIPLKVIKQFKSFAWSRNYGWKSVFREE